MSLRGSYKPKTLREALDVIQELLSGNSYSADLWDVLVALRGPDSRNRKIKNATTALIRTAAFPLRPCLERSVYAIGDSKELAARRRLLLGREQNHFREHIVDAFESLGLKIEEINESPRNYKKSLRRR